MRHLLVLLLMFVSSFIHTCENEGDRVFRSEEDVLRYHRYSSMQRGRAFSRINTIYFPSSARILDVGCGDGRITSYLGSFVRRGKVIGIDISREMVQFANRQYVSNDTSNLAFLIGDAQCLPFANEFDYVISFSCLHWVVDQQEAFESFYGALSPGGHLIVSIGAKHRNELSYAILATVTHEKWAPYFEDYIPRRFFKSEDQYFSMVREAGFVDVRVRKVVKDESFENLTVIREAFASTSALVHHLDEVDRNEFLDDLFTYLSQLVRRDDEGNYRMEMAQFEIDARKPSALRGNGRLIRVSHTL